MNRIKHNFFYLLGLELFFFSFLFSQTTLSKQDQEAALDKSDREIAENSEKIKEFYELGKDEEWREITDKVLASSDTSEESKKSIRTFHRRIFVFKYPSDNLWIKGFISFTPNPNYHPLLLLYRWGNENFALMNPGIIFATYKDYTVISSTLRGGVSEGKDEFGGEDVNDIKNLIDFIPQLAQKLGIQLNPSCVFMLGPSRGGLEMFLTLSRFPELQKRVNKVVALSAILDLHQLINDRPKDMKRMFENQFGLSGGVNGNNWIAKRNPLNTVSFIRQSLPILVIQGTADNRINLAEGRHMVNALKQNKNQVHYWEIPQGNHALTNHPYIMNEIAQWLESDSPCMSIHLPRNKNKRH